MRHRGLNFHHRITLLFLLVLGVPFFFLAADVPAASEAKVAKALVLLSQGQSDTAIRRLEKLASLPGDTSTASLALAQAYNRVQKFGKAATQARSVLDRQNSSIVQARAHTELGLAQFELALRKSSRGKQATLIAQADKSLSRALELGGDEVNAARYYRAEILSLKTEAQKLSDEERQGLYAEIVSLLETFLALDPSHYVALRARTLLCGNPTCNPAERVDLDQPASDGGPYDFSKSDKKVRAPRKIHAEAPQYTTAARKARVNGTVRVQAEISSKGDVVDVRVLQGLPYGLNEATVKAVKKWKFEPALLDEEPVSVYYYMTLNFSIK